MMKDLEFITLIGQSLGILGMIFSTLSFQMSNHKKIMIMQILTAGVFSIHYLLIGGITAAALNGAAVIRNIIFYNKDKKIFSGKFWTVLFAIVMAIFGVISWQGFFSVFMVVGMVINTLSLSFTNPQWVRKTILISSPLMLIYNIFTLSIGGIINELLAEGSAVIGLIRYRRQRAEEV